MTKTPKRAKKTKKLVAGGIVLDWKETPTLEDMEALLEDFGLHIIEHPACEGTDSYGFIVSNRKLTKAELKEAAEAF